MRKLEISQNKYALVDEEDFKRLSAYKWYVNENGYVVRTKYLGGGRKNQKCTVVRMHREVINTPTGMDTDHINRNKLDNRRCNLRICTRSQNMANTPKRVDNTSGFKGVFKKNDYKRNKPWYVRIKVNGKYSQLGHFKTAREASIVYNKKSVELFGKFSLSDNIKLV